jgi:hypothetical protein
MNQTFTAPLDFRCVAVRSSFSNSYRLQSLSLDTTSQTLIVDSRFIILEPAQNLIWERLRLIFSLILLLEDIYTKEDG